MSRTTTRVQHDRARVERALRFLHEQRREQPALEEVARAVGLSPFHLQRLFTRLAGISPKRFLQHLTARDARARLERSASVLDAALGVGLSGPSRLHDLVVAVEGMTPGELKQGGRGLEIATGVHAGPLGPCLVGVTARGVCGFEFLDDDADAHPALAAWRARWPGARFGADAARTARVAEVAFQALERGAAGGGLALHLPGTNFQLQVWRALVRVPAGCVASYARVAAAVGKPGAARAVGAAVGANPVALLVPCHRVLRADGGIGGYRWGAARKRALLALEGARAETP
jgi:AraC family transcriptional regulator of adaptative response/methylated-DNA-[protein]-cysteine methyltransferase